MSCFQLWIWPILRVCFDFASMSHVGGWVEHIGEGLSKRAQRPISGTSTGQLPSLNNESIDANVLNSVDIQPVSHTWYFFYTTVIWRRQEILHLKVRKLATKLCVKQFFELQLEKNYTWLNLLHNQRLWWLWQISSMYTASETVVQKLTLKRDGDTGGHYKVEAIWSFWVPISINTISFHVYHNLLKNKSYQNRV